MLLKRFLKGRSKVETVEGCASSRCYGDTHGNEHAVILEIK